MLRRSWPTSRSDPADELVRLARLVARSFEAGW
jgi:hypothetical protein